ncbi:ThiF family adenylyltransferase [Phycisphaerales bacterium AB-hyl4]|uniref:ThiF family adenylyltransferase n=1 Tax=Natronomicrosphaera hydrolytica TaxID=3242702 RepID=A0ABV4UAF8_9BACT
MATITPKTTAPATDQPDDRDLRQRELVPPEALAACRCTIIGVGAIGRQVALQLAALGVAHLQLVDPDHVEPVNLAAQGYREVDVMQQKVNATAALCRQLHSRLSIEAVSGRFRRSLPVEPVVFACVDAIATRRQVYEAVRGNARLLVDGRMHGEVIRVLAAELPDHHDRYRGTLFNPDQTYAGSCTSRSTIYAANLAAALMVAQLARHLRCQPVEPDQTLNLFAGELTTTR